MWRKERVLAEDDAKVTAARHADLEETFAQVVAVVKDYAIFTLDAGGHVRTWNEGARRIKQYSKQDVLGKHFSVFYTRPDIERNHPSFELEQARKNGSYEEEGWRVRKDGTVFWAAVTITPLSTDGGGFIKVTRDLTERRRYETDLEEARDQAMAAYRAKSQFVANVTHELRTPLSSLVGLSELLANDTTLNAEVHKTAQTMFESSKILLSMLNDLLDFAKLEARKVQLDEIPFSVKKVITDVVELVRIKCEVKNLSIATAIGNDVPETIKGDPAKVRQIILNLIDNAIKFTESGAIEVACDMSESSALISITDTGIGIPAEKQKKLFQPFSQVHGANPKFGGTGLGLSIADQYVRLMGGEIGVNSAEGSGSTFWFTLPIGGAPVK